MELNIDDFEPIRKKTQMFLKNDGTYEFRELDVYELLVDKKRKMYWLSSNNGKLVTIKKP